MQLSEMTEGQRGIVGRVGGNGALRRRLLVADPIHTALATPLVLWLGPALAHNLTAWLHLTLAALAAQEGPHRLVGGEDRARGSQFRAHVGDDVAVHGRQVGQAGPVELEHAAQAAVHVVPAQQLEDHVLGRHPGAKPPRQPHP